MNALNPTAAAMLAVAANNDAVPLYDSGAPLGKYLSPAMPQLRAVVDVLVALGVRSPDVAAHVARGIDVLAEVLRCLRLHPHSTFLQPLVHIVLRDIVTVIQYALRWEAAHPGHYLSAALLRDRLFVHAEPGAPVLFWERRTSSAVGANTTWVVHLRDLAAFDLAIHGSQSLPAPRSPAYKVLVGTIQRRLRDSFPNPEKNGPISGLPSYVRAVAPIRFTPTVHLAPDARILAGVRDAVLDAQRFAAVDAATLPISDRLIDALCPVHECSKLPRKSLASRRAVQPYKAASLIAKSKPAPRRRASSSDSTFSAVSDCLSPVRLAKAAAAAPMPSLGAACGSSGSGSSSSVSDGEWSDDVAMGASAAPLAPHTPQPPFDMDTTVPIEFNGEYASAVAAAAAAGFVGDFLPPSDLFEPKASFVRDSFAAATGVYTLDSSEACNAFGNTFCALADGAALCSDGFYLGPAPTDAAAVDDDAQLPVLPL